MTRLEQRLNSTEKQLRDEIRALRASVNKLSGVSSAESGDVNPTRLSVHSDDDDLPMSERDTSQPNGTGPEGVTDAEWDELYTCYRQKCRAVIACVDDQLEPPAPQLRQHPLMSTVICAIAARAIKPERYQAFVDAADALICKTFQGPPVDLLGFYAIMLLTAWTGRVRLWGYATSIAYDMKLNLAALQLSDDAVEKDEDSVASARAWFTLCCFDLIINMSRPYAIHQMKEYLPHAKCLLSSPYCRPVDRRICTYIDGFIITGDAKSRLQSSLLQTHPLPEAISSLLTSFDDRVDLWFHDVNNKIDPLFQTFHDIQDRNRFMTPYAFMKLYINGLALHGAEKLGSDADPVRQEFIRKALASACLVIQTLWESYSYRDALRYTIDYNGTTMFYASNFITKAIHAQPAVVKANDGCLTALLQAAQVFEQAGALDVASELRREREKFAASTNIVLSPEPPPESVNDVPLFDIPSFLDKPLWDSAFPLINNYMLE